jgi:hypothetical protein
MRRDLLDRFYCGNWSLGVVVRRAALERTTAYIPRQKKDLRSNQTIRTFQEQVRHCLEYLSVPLPLIEVGTEPGRCSGESIISASARRRPRFVGRDFGEDKICLVPPNSLLNFEHYSPVALGIITCQARVCTISPSFPTSLHLPRNRTDQQPSFPTRYRTPIHCQMHLCNVKCRTCARPALSLFLG